MEDKRGVLAELELRGHFHGKREGVRVPMALEVILGGRNASFHARALDVSRTGIRIEVQGEDGDLGGFAAVVEDHFGAGANIRLPGSIKRRRANLIRISVDGSRLGVVFRFERPLSKKMCKRLGLPLEGDKDPEAGSSDTP